MLKIKLKGVRKINRGTIFSRYSKMKGKGLHMVAFVLVVVGGLNLGLTALGINVVSLVLGSFPALERLLYILIGLSAAYLAVTHSPECKACR